MAAGIRLYVDGALGEGALVAATADQAHYLGRVMRLGVGDPVLLFNGRDGEWRAEIARMDKRAAEMIIREKTRDQSESPGPWLAFAPVKKTGTDFIVQKATELGASRLLPVVTANTQTGRTNTERLRAQAVEAAEQCERLSVPDVSDMIDLDALLADWPRDRPLFVLDETGGGASLAAAAGTAGAAVGFLVGPEGGFQARELDRFAKLPFITPVTLGPRILRAETACLAALAVWQAVVGDWT
ncbi:16S rRNA (uracil(1498)-N(3))-methyltransferase [Thalassospiraceae bacterium LMO-SO8]|nr:16S rRNA (uracil(1498)-N(3))-methyltransferase [Alphaproteobacteria bacterium LMO-S08]WND77919.1 16S rRNA (uracil(1498)-N(3))-methyltransferase [Thalassospiraceae bacterium LMO-SO8]